MRIYFTRHGESRANILRKISNGGLVHPLTQKGREQAAALADRLNYPAIACVSTPARCSRAIETSIIAAERLGVEYQVTDALREFDCGSAEGRADQAAWHMWHEVFDDLNVHLGGGTGASRAVRVFMTSAIASCRSLRISWPNTAIPMPISCAWHTAASSG